jgi:hypothetical protein
MRCTAAALAFTAVLPAFSQATRDFLTADEVDQIRATAQDPAARLKLYVQFAKQRVDMLTQSVAREKPGRSAFIHQTLEDYTKIIEAIDTVADDALQRNVDLAEGIAPVAEAEEKLLAALKRIQDSSPADLERYKFALITAIETTEDSMELAKEDLAERKRDVNVKLREEQKKREAMMTPTEIENRRASEQKKAEEEKKQRKAPTLRRKGEVPDKKP